MADYVIKSNIIFRNVIFLWFLFSVHSSIYNIGTVYDKTHHLNNL